jgi:hypothetical protein
MQTFGGNPLLSQENSNSRRLFDCRTHSTQAFPFRATRLQAPVWRVAFLFEHGFSVSWIAVRLFMHYQDFCSGFFSHSALFGVDILIQPEGIPLPEVRFFAASARSGKYSRWVGWNILFGWTLITRDCRGLVVFWLFWLLLRLIATIR